MQEQSSGLMMFKLYLNTIKCHQQTTSARLLTYEKNIGLGGEIEEDHASEEVTSFSKVKWRAILITSQLSLSLSSLCRAQNSCFPHNQSSAQLSELMLESRKEYWGKISCGRIHDVWMYGQLKERCHWRAAFN